MLKSNGTIRWRAIGRTISKLLSCVLAAIAAPHAATGQTTQPSAAGGLIAPASLDEAAAIIDFQNFPSLERGELLHQTPVKLGYTLAKPDLSKDVQFYRDKFADAGWKIDNETIDAKLAFGTFRAAKQGFVVDVTICQNPNDKKMQVFLENIGNVDARAIPLPPAAEVTQSQPNVTIFKTDKKLTEVAKFVRGELMPLGWRETVHPYMPPEEEEREDLALRFIQRGMSIGASIRVEEGKTEVMYHVGMLKETLPFMPDAKGRIQQMDEPFQYLGYVTPSKPDAVLKFYRKELGAMGWSARSGTDKIEGGKSKVIFETAGKEPLRLEMLNEGGSTIVLITNQPDE